MDGEINPEVERNKKFFQAAAVFTPGAPIDQNKLFSGRVSHMQDVINAVAQRGRHVILFGERGVGKTSLAKTVVDMMSFNNFVTMRSATINADPTDNFSSLWHKVFRELPTLVVEKAAGYGEGTKHRPGSLDAMLPEDVTPDDVRHSLQILKNQALIVIDEVDRIRDGNTTTLLADTIKNLSDHSTKATLLLVGVADTVGELIAEHASIERALAQIRMPRMLGTELHGILEKGLAELGMTMEAAAKERIVKLSQGLPEYTHSLGLYSSQRAIMDGRDSISWADLSIAIETAVEKVQQSIRDAYHKATVAPRKDNLFPKVLLACALAQTDILGYFSASSVRTPLSKIANKHYDIPAFTRHLSDLSEDSRGSILQKIGTSRRFRFRFMNPLMQPFVIAHGLAKGLLDNKVLDELTLVDETKHSK